MPSVSVGTAATLIIAVNSQRLSLVMTNTGSAVWIGETSTLTTGSGPFIVSGGSFTEDSGGTKMYCGPFYGACKSGTSQVSYWERTR